MIKRDKLRETIGLIEKQITKARGREAILIHCTNPASKEVALSERGAVNAYENVLEALKHNDLVFLRI